VNCTSFFGTICSQTFQAGVLLAPAEARGVAPLCLRARRRCASLEMGQSEGRWLSPLLALVARPVQSGAGARDGLMDDRFI